MKFISILLKEGRKEDLKKRYANKFKETDLDWILNISDLVDFNHKYSDFVLKNIDPNSQTFEEDVQTAVEIIKDFDKYQSNLEKRDINQYNNLWDLDSVLEPIKAKERDRELEKQVERIYENDKFLVVRPLTRQASCKYGANTKWCTTSPDAGHFERYTQGLQRLYYIINKANSKNQNYSKVAIHLNTDGTKSYWDSQDSPLSDREKNIFNYAFPEIVEAIDEDFHQSAISQIDKKLNEIFDSYGVTNLVSAKEPRLSLILKGFEKVGDLENRAIGNLSIFIDNNLVDTYLIFIVYNRIDDRLVNIDFGFSFDDTKNSDDLIDTGLESFSLNTKFAFGDNPVLIADRIRKYLGNTILNHIMTDEELQQKLYGSNRFWRPNLGYGYTFGKNKGLVKKLVDFLDLGKVGTKIDFLTHIGYIKPVTKDGRKGYKKTKDNLFYKPRELRGQHSSFFAAAKNAGILKYRKIGKDYFLTKGPNFEAFKQGKLKAL